MGLRALTSCRWPLRCPVVLIGRRGYVALAFDHTSFGDSGGESRQDEDAFTKSEDIQVTHLLQA